MSERLPVPVAAPRRPPPDDLSDSLDRAFERLLFSGPPGAPASATTAADRAAVHGTYLELAVEYCAPIRNVMLEVRWGEPPLRWLEPVRPALAALRAMAVEVELDALAAALAGFHGAVTAALGSGAMVVGPERRAELLATYAPLSACLPQAFDLEGERDRREPIILRALLSLVPELTPLALERLLAAGLTTMEQIADAAAEEIAAVTGLDPSLAARIAEGVRAERSLGTEVGEERRRLAALTARLGDEQRALEQAAAGWSAQSQGEKRRWRRQRAQSWLRVQISLARMGEVERIDRLEPLPFARRVEALARFLGQP